MPPVLSVSAKLTEVPREFKREQVFPYEDIAIYVPAVMFVDQVKGLAVRPVYCWRAAAPGWLPGLILDRTDD